MIPNKNTLGSIFFFTEYGFMSRYHSREGAITNASGKKKNGAMRSIKFQLLVINDQ